MKGIFLAYYIFAVGHLTGPYSYPPDIPVENTDALLSEINENGLVHPWNGAKVQAEIAQLVALRSAYPNVPVSLAVNGGADGAYWHDAGSVYDADFHAAMQTLRAAGIKIYGYVDPTVYTADMASAKEKVSRWYTLYADILDGIFLDDYAVSDYLPDWPYLSVEFYDELNTYIRAKRNPTQPAVVPLICGNINGWWNGNRDSQNTAYFSSSHAADFWLVAESIVNPEYMNPAGVTSGQKWALLYNTPSAGISDAQFNSLMSSVDWVMISERSYATYQYLPSWLGRQAQLLADINNTGYASGYMAFTQQPLLSNTTPDGGVVSYATMDSGADDPSSTAVSYSSVLDVQIFRGAAAALISSQVSATSVQTMLEHVFTAAQVTVGVSDTMQHVESILAQIQAFPTVQDVMTMAAQAIAPFIFVDQPTVSAGTGDGGVISYSTADAVAEDAESTAAATTQVVDMIVRLEGVLSVVQAIPTVADLMAQVESVASTAQAQASVLDVRITGLAENLLTAAEMTASADDAQGMVDNIITMAQSGCSIVEINGYLESVVSSGSVQATVLDIQHGRLVVIQKIIVAVLDPLLRYIRVHDPLLLKITTSD